MYLFKEEEKEAKLSVFRKIILGMGPVSLISLSKTQIVAVSPDQSILISNVKNQKIAYSAMNVLDIISLATVVEDNGELAILKRDGISFASFSSEEPQQIHVISHALKETSRKIAQIPEENLFAIITLSNFDSLQQKSYLRIFDTVISEGIYCSELLFMIEII